MLKNVFHVPGMKKNLLYVPQITALGRYVLFGPTDVNIYDKFETSSNPVIQGRKAETVYVLSAGTAYVEKTKSNQNAYLWHQRLSHVGYDRLEIMMNRSVAVGLPKLSINKDVVCGGFQYGKAHEQPFDSSQSHWKSSIRMCLGPLSKPRYQV
ncbi:uncharacterized protein LOC143531097 [Bidens hawaiensis]|uniref:uncharacterized protein LOC143531097 n=1 Tax=Bidens hawaiensis TaxID=980011 RepID=UPI00404AD428